MACFRVKLNRALNVATSSVTRDSPGFSALSDLHGPFQRAKGRGVKQEPTGPHKPLLPE